MLHLFIRNIGFELILCLGKKLPSSNVEDFVVFKHISLRSLIPCWLRYLTMWKAIQHNVSRKVYYIRAKLHFGNDSIDIWTSFFQSNMHSEAFVEWHKQMLFLFYSSKIYQQLSQFSSILLLNTTTTPDPTDLISHSLIALDLDFILIFS